MNFKFVLLLGFFLLQTSLYSQDKADSLKKIELDSLINLKIENQENIISEQNELIDTLKKDIQQYQIQEKYYTTSLRNQMVLFTVIISVLMFIGGFVSFQWYKRDKKKFGRKINRIKSKMISRNEELIKKQKKHFGDLNGLAGNTSILIANEFEEKGDHYKATKYSLASVYYGLKDSTISEDKLLIRLNYTITSFRNITVNQAVKDEYANEIELISDYLKNIEKHNSEEVKDKAAELRLLYRTLR